MHCKTLILYACALCAILPRTAAAQEKLAYGPPHYEAMLTCGSSNATSSLALQEPDRDNMELARAYTAKLRNEGQDGRIIKSIYKASLRSGVSFELLLMKGIMESDLGRFNVAETSSARGPFQYIEPTWLTLMKRYGAQAGYPQYAESIRLSKYSGVPFVAGKNTYLKAEILALRHDPDVAALITAYQVKEETEVLRSYKNGETVTATDHYIAHLMGLKLARELYDLRAKHSIIAVAGLNKPEMREAARLNRQFFFDGQRPLTAEEVYEVFDRRIAREYRRIGEVARYKPAVICTASNQT